MWETTSAGGKISTGCKGTACNSSTWRLTIQPDPNQTIANQPRPWNIIPNLLTNTEKVSGDTSRAESGNILITFSLNISANHSRSGRDGYAKVSSTHVFFKAYYWKIHSDCVSEPNLTSTGSAYPLHLIFQMITQHRGQLYTGMSWDLWFLTPCLQTVIKF